VQKHPCQRGKTGEQNTFGATTAPAQFTTANK